MSILLLTAFMLAPSTVTTQVVALDLDGLVEASSGAIWGRVVNLDAGPRDGNAKVVETTVTLEIYGRHARPSAPPPTARFVVPGGRFGRFAQVVPGAPRLRLGDELVVLIEPLARGRQGVAGFNQGLWRVERTAQSDTVVSDRTGVELVPAPAPRLTARVPRDERTFDALWQELATRLGGAR